MFKQHKQAKHRLEAVEAGAEAERKSYSQKTKLCMNSVEKSHNIFRSQQQFKFTFSESLLRLFFRSEKYEKKFIPKSWVFLLAVCLSKEHHNEE